MNLYPYQIDGATWLAQKRYALLADEQGLGKTVQAIRAAVALRAGSIIVLCPAVARLNWVREFEMWSGTQCGVVWPILSEADAEFSERPQVIVCSYDLAMRPSVHKRLVAFQPDILILDEAHFLKTLTTGRTGAALTIPARRVWALTATFIPNGEVNEITPLLNRFQLISGEGCHDKFLAKFSTPRVTDFGTKYPLNKNVSEFKKLLEPIMLRRTKAQVLPDLPPISFADVLVEAGPVDMETHFMGVAQQQIDAQRTLVDNQLHRAKTEAEKEAALERIQGQVGSLRRFTGLQKVKAVAELVDAELDCGAVEKIVLFCMHRDVIEELRHKLRKYNPVILYGGTDPVKRDKNVKTFQENPKCRVFIGQVVAAGTAITLTAAHHVLFVETDWVPGNNAQAAMRCHRIGQGKPVFVRFATLAASIDEHVQRTVVRKARAIAQVFGG